MKIEAILKLPVNCDDHKGTIKSYLGTLLLTLWEEGEGFSGKRPFGNSGWEYDLYKPLIMFEVINGTVDEYGDIEDFDKKTAFSMINKCIEHMFKEQAE
jgi:hypothetical protein